MFEGITLPRRTVQFARFAALTALLTLPAFAQRGPGGEHGGGMGPGGPGGFGDRGMMGMGRPGGDFGRGNPNTGFGGSAPPLRGPQLGLPGRWWDDKRMSRSVTLRPDQQRRMDDIFNANKGQLLSLYSNLQHEEQKLATMPSADLQDEAKVFAGIDRVAQARADLEKENAHILLQIRKELDGEQLSRLDKEIANNR